MQGLHTALQCKACTRPMLLLLLLLPLVVLPAAATMTSSSTCVADMNSPQGDLPGMPVAAPDPAACAALCEAASNCSLYTFQTPGCTYAGNGGHNGATCEVEDGGGCCWLKAEEVNGVAPTVDPCSCTGIVRAKSGGFIPPARPPPGATNVLYILVDDLRPELQPFGQTYAHTPHIQAFADGGMVFQNAYCQISVCSPSRMSFLTGRRPDHSGIWNFVNHVNSDPPMS
eukprot:COSAG01_NODE_19154_length_1027_cov_1.979526_1_plen_227_part_01